MQESSCGKYGDVGDYVSLRIMEWEDQFAS